MESLKSKLKKIIYLLFSMFFIFACANNNNPLIIEHRDIKTITVYDNYVLEKEDISLFCELYNSMDKKLEDGYFNKHEVGAIGYRFTIETDQKTYTLYLDEAGLIYVGGTWYEVDAFHELFDLVREWSLNKYHFYDIDWAKEADGLSMSHTDNVYMVNAQRNINDVLNEIGIDTLFDNNISIHELIVEKNNNFKLNEIFEFENFTLKIIGIKDAKISSVILKVK